MTVVPTEVLPSGHKELMTARNPKVSYSESMARDKDDKWAQLRFYTVEQALQMWYKILTPITRRNYKSGMEKLICLSLVFPTMTLQDFVRRNHNSIVDAIKRVTGWSECTRQARAACYISFTRYMSRETEGMIPRVIPCKDEGSKTFYKVRDEVDTEAMSQAQWLGFFTALESINSRDCLIAKVILQGAKRVDEVLSLTYDQINWKENQITFIQSKTKQKLKTTIITYPLSIMQVLALYLKDRKSGLVFITSTGKKLPRLQLANTFAKAGIKAGIPFTVHPHVLRASAITYYRESGHSDSDIQKISGHASFEQLSAYDKSSRADNASKKVSLVA
jgi:integrase